MITYENIHGRVGHKLRRISGCDGSPARVRWLDGGLGQEVILPDGQALQELLFQMDRRESRRLGRRLVVGGWRLPSRRRGV